VNVFMRERLRGALLRYCLKRADKIIAVSAALATTLKERGVPANKIAVVRNGVDTDLIRLQDRLSARVALGLPVAGKIVLCVGNIVRIKGQDILLDAFARLDEKSARLVFVGDGDMRAGLTRRALEMGLAESVRFAGVQPHERIADWLAAADILCLPSRNEGLPNVALEALSAGRPIVATRVGGIEEVVTSDAVGIVVPSEDPASLCQALGTALVRNWDITAIRREAMSHSWDDTVRQCNQVWREAVNEHNRQGRGFQW
jgi:glycosyltransferase involved in cell wall biosynthesis